jgi:hypothetical protein
MAKANAYGLKDVREAVPIQQATKSTFRIALA